MTPETRARRWAAVCAERERLLRISRARTLTEEDAEDCVQEAMLRCVEFPDLDEERIGAFLTTVTIRLCADQHRVRGRTLRAGARLAAATRHESGPEDGVCDRAEAAWVADRLATLSPHQRRVVEERAADHSCAAVAARLGISVDAVKCAMSRARTTVRAALSSTTALVVWIRHPRTAVVARYGTASVAAGVALTGIVTAVRWAPPERPPVQAAPAPAPPAGAARSVEATPVTVSPPAAPKRPAAARPRAAAEAAPPAEERAPAPPPQYRVRNTRAVGSDERNDEYDTPERVQHCLTYGVVYKEYVGCRYPPEPDKGEPR